MRIFISLLLLVLFVNPATSKHQKVIVIQPFGDFPKKQANLVLGQIKEINPSTILRNNIPFPKTAFYKPRNRYRADSLIKFLSSKVGKDTVIVGLSLKDISTTKGKIKDWGVMGLGYCPGKACVASSFRLSKKNTQEQFYKVAIHELGHTQGLPHCKDKTCLMRDAEGGNPLNEEKDFCASCKKYLKNRNWKLR